MINIEEVKAKALECGFTTVAEMDVDTIELNPAARDACAENKCHSYGKNWSCPPGCGTLDECSERIHKYKRGLILQTTGEVDTMDFEEIMELAQNHGEHVRAFADYVHKHLEGTMLCGDSACRNCKTCTYPDEPCRFPDKLSHPMEGLGMIVSEVCLRNNVKYYYGPGTLTYVACIMLD